ncbi:MAG: restriction endonuclease-like protein [Polyangiaceae bacterium]|nr:restriction endonuclease-like protein [Polyangiaceae bacterium]
MAELSIRSRQTKTAPPQINGRWVLATEQEWLIEGLPVALDAIEHELAGVCERVGGVLLLNFRNVVGRFNLPYLGPLEVASGKWTDADFDHLLADVTEIAAALPFSSRVGGGLPYERTALPEQQVPYHAFVYLRYILSDAAPLHEQLGPSLRRVVAQPHRKLVPRGRVVPLERARLVGTRGLVRILEQPGDWIGVERGYGGPLALALRNHLPEQIEEDHRTATLDTPENRFVLMFLELCRSIVERTRNTASAWSGFSRSRLLDDCDRIQRVLAPIRSHAMWRDVGQLAHVPAGSSVLQRQYGYRDVLRHYVRLRLVSRIPLDDDAVEDLLGLKDVATLYELWCFFAVVDAARACLGRPVEASTPRVEPGQLTVPWGFRVAWSDGSELFYNASFTPKSKDPAFRSTSVVLRPDVTLRIPDGPARGVHLFDAKFRLQALPTDDADDVDATFKRADLYKMHTYRDAIPSARSAWIIYPGTEERFFATSGGAGCDGVGGVPGLPGDLEAIRSRVRRVLQSAV